MNKVLLTGRLTRDPELRTTAGGKSVAQFSIASHAWVAGKEQAEFHDVVAWGRLAETCGRHLGRGQLVSVEGRIRTRTWDDADGRRHWRTEIVAAAVEMLSARRRRDHAGQIAAAALEAQALAEGGVDPGEPLADDGGFGLAGGGDEVEEEDELLEEAVPA